jgi:excisionase family DNA binding protein
MTTAPLLCSTKDAARLLGIGSTKLWDLISSKELQTHRIGARRLVRIDSINALLERTAV